MHTTNLANFRKKWNYLWFILKCDLLLDSYWFRMMKMYSAFLELNRFNRYYRLYKLVWDCGYIEHSFIIRYPLFSNAPYLFFYLVLLLKTRSRIKLDVQVHEYLDFSVSIKFGHLNLWPLECTLWIVQCNDGHVSSLDTVHWKHV